MLRFVAARLVQSLVALAIISVVVFVLARATGDPLYLILPMSASQEDFDNARRYLGLDRPYVEQYLSFVGRAVTGDFGKSSYHLPTQPPPGHVCHVWNMWLAALTPKTSRRPSWLAVTSSMDRLSAFE